jgi:hypothetical protein
MKTRWPVCLVLTALIPLGGAATARSDGFRHDRLNARLRGANETPAVSTVAAGDFRATISDDESEIAFRLRYAGLEGDVTAAHIHLGQPDVAGGVIAHLCGGGSKPACPAAPADITGTIVAADVTGPAGQGIAAGELAEVIRALRRGLVYANVHSTKFPAGEIRGQVGGFND